MPILGSSNLTANNDMMARIWTNGDKNICLIRKQCGEKGEIARYEQFLLFPQCFQKQSGIDVLKRVSMEKRVKTPFTQHVPSQMCTALWEGDFSCIRKPQ